jgi:phytanoyl-CoA hydroxylase
MSTPAVDLTRRTESPGPRFTPLEVEQFQRDGYVIVRALADAELCRQMLEATHEGLLKAIGPLEYEADLHYPGSPTSRESDGGRTIRRLKQAHSRHFAFTDWVGRPELTGRLQQLLGSPVIVPLAHHNCIMTKQPHFSSDTGWHQDIRYWSYARPELVSVWTALTPERPENGCLKLIPKSHTIVFDHTRLDEDLFLRTDVPENQTLIDSAITAELDPGDVLFFHCRTLHAADRNRSDTTKVSVVFTFRPGDNPPTAGTRSASLPELLIPVESLEPTTTNQTETLQT